MPKFPEYDASKIHLSPFPEPQDAGHGWWRKTWEVIVDPSNPVTDLRLPPLSRDIEDRPLIVVLLPQEPGRILVEVFATIAAIMDEEMVYIASVMQALRASSRRISINGESDHIILHMIK